MLWNLFLMLAWAALTNDFSLENLVAGFIVGFLTLALLSARGIVGSGRYIRTARRSIGFLGFYIYEIILSNIRMAKDVLSPTIRSRPAIVQVPLSVSTDSEAEITLLANLISLTPGTLSVDVSPDRQYLYVHTMDLPNGDAEAFCQKLKHDLERRVLEVLH